MRRALLCSLAFACFLLALPPLAHAQVNLAAGKPVTASSFFAGFPVANAVDPDTSGTAWNAGSFGPSWIEVDLGAEYLIGSFVGKAAAAPTGEISHSITGRRNIGTTLSLGSWSGTVGMDQLVPIPCSTALPVRYIRITSASSASWIAWWDVRLYEGSAPVRTTTDTWGRIKSLFAGR